MPVPTLKKQADGSLEVVKPRDDIAPIFIWESSRFLFNCNQNVGPDDFGMALQRVREYEKNKGCHWST